MPPKTTRIPKPPDYSDMECNHSFEKCKISGTNVKPVTPHFKNFFIERCEADPNIFTDKMIQKQQICKAWRDSSRKRENYPTPASTPVRTRSPIARPASPVISSQPINQQIVQVADLLNTNKKILKKFFKNLKMEPGDENGIETVQKLIKKFINKFSVELATSNIRLSNIHIDNPPPPITAMSPPPSFIRSPPPSSSMIPSPPITTISPPTSFSRSPSSPYRIPTGLPPPSSVRSPSPPIRSTSPIYRISNISPPDSNSQSGKLEFDSADQFTSPHRASPSTRPPSISPPKSKTRSGKLEFDSEDQDIEDILSEISNPADADKIKKAIENCLFPINKTT